MRAPQRALSGACYLTPGVHTGLLVRGTLALDAAAVAPAGKARLLCMVSSSLEGAAAGIAEQLLAAMPQDGGVAAHCLMALATSDTATARTARRSRILVHGRQPPAAPVSHASFHCMETAGVALLCPCSWCHSRRQNTAPLGHALRTPAGIASTRREPPEVAQVREQLLRDPSWAQTVVQITSSALRDEAALLLAVAPRRTPQAAPLWPAYMSTLAIEANKALAQAFRAGLIRGLAAALHASDGGGALAQHLQAYALLLTSDAGKVPAAEMKVPSPAERH